MAIVHKRAKQHVPDVSQRYPVFCNALMNGSSWEPTTAELLDSLDQLPPCFSVTKPAKRKAKYKKKRLGAKRVKDLERLDAKGEELQGEDATL